MSEGCPRIEDLSAYADGEATPAQRARLDAHLAACPTCRHWLDALHGVQAQMRTWSDDSLGFDLSQVVRGRIEAQPRPAAPVRSRPGWRWLVPAGMGAAASLALGLALGLALTVPAASVSPLARSLEVFAPVAPGGLCAGSLSCRRLESEITR